MIAEFGENDTVGYSISDTKISIGCNFNGCKFHYSYSFVENENGEITELKLGKYYYKYHSIKNHLHGVKMLKIEDDEVSNMRDKTEDKIEESKEVFEKIAQEDYFDEESSNFGTAFKLHRRDYFYSESSIKLFKSTKQFSSLTDIKVNLIEPMNQEFKNRDTLFIK